MIYLDANATSRLRPEAASALFEACEGGLETGNPSSVHKLGRDSKLRQARARTALLELMGFAPAGVKPGGIGIEPRLFFTSGGTESCNSMLLGLLGNAAQIVKNPGRVVASAIEHAAVEEPLKQLELNGWEIVRVLPQNDGIVSAEEISEAALSRPTDLVCLMGANNVSGAVQPIDLAARGLRRSGFSGIIVSDLTQALGKTFLSLPELFAAGVDAAAFSGHKLGAPSGVGAVVLAGASCGRCYSYNPLMSGGPQEERLRPGTENLLGIIAWGRVAAALKARLPAELSRISALRELLWRRLEQAADFVRLTPPGSAYGSVAEYSGQKALSNTLTFRLPGCRGDDLVAGLDLAGIAASTGSACASGKQSVSPVLLAAGLSRSEARQAVRLSLDWDCSEESVNQAAEIIIRVALRMRESIAPAGLETASEL